MAALIVAGSTASASSVADHFSISRERRTHLSELALGKLESRSPAKRLVERASAARRAARKKAARRR